MFLTGIWVWNILRNRSGDMIIQEDLFTPGFFEFKAKEGDIIVFSASTKEEKTSGLKAEIHKNSISKDSTRQFYKLSEECCPAIC